MAKDKSKKKDKAEDPWAPASGSADDYNLDGPGSSAPPDADRFTIADHVDRVLLVMPRDRREVSTEYGTNEITEADIVVLDETTPKDSKEYPGAWIFATVVQNQLTDALGRKSKVVGRLVLDQELKKPGRNAPYRLKAPENADIDVAKRYLDSVNPLR